MEQCLGNKYVLVSSENFEEYLKYIGVGYLGRKMASSLKPTQSLTLNEDGTYTFEFVSTFASSAVTFTSGVEFVEVKPDGTKVRATITIEGNTMIHVQVEENGRTSKHVREFYPDKMVATTTAVGLDKVTTRMYELVQ